MESKGSLLLVDDDDTFRLVMSRELARRGYTLTPVGSVARAKEALATGVFDLALIDLHLPDGDGLEVLAQIVERGLRTEVIVLTGHGTIDTAIQAVKLGAFDYLTKPCPTEELEIKLGKALERRLLLQRNQTLESALLLPQSGASFVGRSAWHQETLRHLMRVAPTDSSVLILGETGTGKEVIAKLTHANSARRDKAFVVVDCTSLHDELQQSELFGHERGAFTGASQGKDGLFAVADGGTIFLDEVGDMGMSTQVKLLRVLESSTFRRLGGNKELKVDVRVVAATNRDLGALIAQGHFRSDLFYRLATIRIDLLPLRDRREDIPALVEHFVARMNARFGLSKSVSREAMALLEDHAWPGNVRELSHVIEQALIVSEQATIEPTHLPLPLRTSRALPGPAEAELLSLQALERQHIERVLKAAGGHRSRAAQILGISERNLYRKLREHDLA